MAWEENSHICLHMQLIAILSRIEVIMLKERSKKHWKIGKTVVYLQKISFTSA